MRRWAWAVGLGSIGALAWGVSCVGDNGAGIAQGADGGACFSNGTCDPGLVCQTQNGNAVCLPAGADASSGEGGSDATGDVLDAGPPCTYADAAAPTTAPSACVGSGTDYWVCYDVVDGGWDKQEGGFGCWGQQDPNGTTGPNACAPRSLKVECTWSTVSLTKGAYYCCLSGGRYFDSSCGPQLDFSGGGALSGAGGYGLPCGNGESILCNPADASACAYAQTAGLVEAGTCTGPIAIDGVPLLAGDYLGICR